MRKGNVWLKNMLGSNRRFATIQLQIEAERRFQIDIMPPKKENSRLEKAHDPESNRVKERELPPSARGGKAIAQSPINHPNIPMKRIHRHPIDDGFKAGRSVTY